MQIRLVCAYVYTVHVNRPEQILELVKTVRGSASVLISEFSAGCINENDFAGLCIGKFNKACAGQGDFGAVSYRNGDDIVAFVEQAQGRLEIGFDEIRDEKDRGLFASDLGNIFKGLCNVRSSRRHIEIQ